MDTKDWIILLTAVWGAVTGTVSLFIKLRDVLYDRPKLLVQPKFEYSGFDIPLETNLVINVINIGHRPTIIDHISATFYPKAIWKRLFWWLERKMRLSYSSRAEQTLVEGMFTTFHFSEQSIREVTGREMTLLKRIIVQDKAGRTWTSSTKYGQAGLIAHRSAKKLESEDLETNDKGRSFSIRLYREGKSFTLKARYLLGNKYEYHFATFKDIRNAKITYSELMRKGLDFIDGKRNNPFET